jgi:hypothetical protein
MNTLQPYKDFDLLVLVNEKMRNFLHPWFVAGGFAIDLFCKRITRPHQDLDLTVFRDSLKDLILYFGSSSEAYVTNSVNKEKVKINSEYILKNGEHEVHIICNHFHLEFLIIDKLGDEVVYRRDKTIKLHFQDFYYHNIVPYVAPEWQLLYKAKALRAKDQQDFETVISLLSNKQKLWLIRALEQCFPDHLWLKKLKLK